MKITSDTKTPAAWRAAQNIRLAESKDADAKIAAQQKEASTLFGPTPGAGDGDNAALIGASFDGLSEDPAALIEPPFDESDEEPAALLELSFAARNLDAENGTLSNIHEKDDAKESDSKIDDPTYRLTRRLVTAKTINEVHSILFEAFKSLGDTIQAAATGDKKAQNVLRRLNKLIRRATRKVRDLGNEDEIRRKKEQARRKEIEHLARQLEQELKRKLEERKRREMRYLRDAKTENDENRPNTENLSAKPSPAQIKAMARQAAQAAVMAQPSSAVPPGEAGGAPSSGEAGSSGEPASEGGEGDSGENGASVA